MINQLILINLLQAALGYGLWTNQSLNGRGNLHFAHPTASEAPFTQTMRTWALADLYFSHALTAQIQSQSPADVTGLSQDFSLELPDSMLVKKAHFLIAPAGTSLTSTLDMQVPLQEFTQKLPKALETEVAHFDFISFKQEQKQQGQVDIQLSKDFNRPQDTFVGLEFAPKKAASPRDPLVLTGHLKLREMHPQSRLNRYLQDFKIAGHIHKLTIKLSRPAHKKRSLDFAFPHVAQQVMRPSYVQNKSYLSYHLEKLVQGVKEKRFLSMLGFKCAKNTGTEKGRFICRQDFATDKEFSSEFLAKLGQGSNRWMVNWLTRRSVNDALPRVQKDVDQDLGRVLLEWAHTWSMAKKVFLPPT